MKKIILTITFLIIISSIVLATGVDSYTKLMLHSNYSDVSSDSFTGNNGDFPDTNIWRDVYAGAGNISIQNNKLREVASTSGQNSGICSNFKIAGDFDVQMNYTLINYPSTTQWYVNSYVYLKNPDNTYDVANMYRNYNTANRYNTVMYDDDSLVDNTIITTSDTQGRFRFTRSGSSWSAYYWNSGWTQLGLSHSMSTEPVFVCLTMMNNVANPLGIVDYDDFVINSGNVVYTDFNDSSFNNHVISAKGNSVHDTRVSKFGDTSIYFDGTGDYLTINDSDDWDFGADSLESYTVDFWYKFDSIPSSGQIHGVLWQYLNDNAYLGIYHNYNAGGWQIFAYDGTGWVGTNYAGLVNDTGWHHIAFVKQGGSQSTSAMYIDGGLVGASVRNTSYEVDINASIDIGHGNSAWTPNYFNGYIDELRISKGVARWTSNFTPPTAPYDLVNPPVYSAFTSTETTNFSSVSDLTNVTNITLAVSSKGKIKFGESTSINIDGADLDSNIIIDTGVVFVNSSALDSSFNTSASLTFEGVDCSKPYIYYSESSSTFDGILRDNIRCAAPQCTNIQCNAGTLTVDVAHFTGYAAGANANLTIDAETGSKLVGESVEFNATYINATSGVAISGECNISFDDAWGTWTEMTYNSGVYYYNKSFASSGTHWYNVTCYNSSYNTLEATDSKLVSGTGVPEFNIWTVGIGLLVIVVGLYFRKAN